MTNSRENIINYKMGILAQTAFYGPNIERSFGRPLMVRARKADALANALPEPERTSVQMAFDEIETPYPGCVTAAIWLGLTAFSWGVVLAVIYTAYLCLYL